MFSKVAIFFAIFAAANATALLGLASTGSSVTSRKQDAHGNYAFGYSVNDGHASSKSQSEVGTGGHKASAYNSHINHVAPAVAVGHAAPAIGLAAPAIGLAAPAVGLGYGAPLAVAAPLAHAAPVAYSSAINHVAAAPVVAGHGIGAGYGVLGAGYGALGAGYGVLGAGHLGYGNGVLGHGLLAH